EVILRKEGGSLGFSIIGGTDHSCMPFGATEAGIFISHVVPGGIAAQSGKLRMGDRILKVNGEDITKSTHQEAVLKLLKPGDEIVLTVQHDPLPEGFQELRIVKAEGEKLGMHIKGGLRGHRGNPLDRSDEGVFISKINSGGAAKRDGRLKVGMRLLEVNGVSLLGASHQEAVNVLRSSGNEIVLVVCKGYDKAEVDRLMAEGKLTKESKSVSQSVSSLDRDDEDTATIRQEQEMKQELVEWEKEEKERKDKELEVHQGQQLVSLAEAAREKSTPERVLDVVRAAELLVNKPSSPTEMLVPKSPGGPKTDLKTTTIVMSKHTLAPQTSTPVSDGPKPALSDAHSPIPNAASSSTLPRTTQQSKDMPTKKDISTVASPLPAKSEHVSMYENSPAPPPPPPPNFSTHPLQTIKSHPVHNPHNLPPPPPPSISPLQSHPVPTHNLPPPPTSISPLQSHPIHTPRNLPSSPPPPLISPLQSRPKPSPPPPPITSPKSRSNITSHNLPPPPPPPSLTSLQSRPVARPPDLPPPVPSYQSPLQTFPTEREKSHTHPQTTKTREDDLDSSIEDLLDPIARSRKPNARLSGKKINPSEMNKLNEIIAISDSSSPLTCLRSISMSVFSTGYASRISMLTIG
ncbi:hypothetical protein L9F63_003465, partial [Diploptera punctata]